MASTPVITLLGSDQTTAVSAWHVGTVKSQQDSDILEVNIWNNKGEATNAVSNIQDATITTLASDGTSTGELVTNTWVQVRVNNAVDTSSNAVYTKIGGDTTAALAYMGATGDDLTNGIIKGTTNDGTAANSAVNYCNVKLKVNVPMNATAGSQSFKVRVQGYYV